MSGPPIAAGGIANGGVAILNSTQVNNNTASHTSGGGIVNHGTMTLNNSQVNGNTAPAAALSPPAGESSAPRASPDRRPPPSPSLTAG